jgi:hypothetical protein
MPDFIKNSIRVKNFEDLADVQLQTTPANCNSDAFGRLRVSDPYTIFSNQNQYDIGSDLWDDTLTGSGTVSHLPNESSVRLQVSTNNGDKVVRQTRRYFRYQPGKSHNIILTCVLDPKTNVRYRLGYFDNNDGIFFENNSGTMGVVIRTSTSKWQSC